MEIHRTQIAFLICIGMIIIAGYETATIGNTPDWFVLISTNIVSWVLSAKTQQSK